MQITKIIKELLKERDDLDAAIESLARLSTRKRGPGRPPKFIRRGPGRPRKRK